MLSGCSTRCIEEIEAGHLPAWSVCASLTQVVVHDAEY